MTPNEIDQIAEAAANKAVRSTLLSLGINVDDPTEVMEAQLDFQHLRAWRESTQAVKRKALTTAVGIIITGAIGWLVLAFQWPGR